MNEVVLKRDTPAERLKRMRDTAALINERIAELELALSNAKAELLAIEREDMPELLRELGLDSVTIDGVDYKLQQGVDISIPKGLAAEPTFAWLEEHGHGGIIKADVHVAFSRNRLDEANACVASLQEAGYGAYMDQKVAPQTLKAWAKERIEAGEEIPRSLFKLSPYTFVKMKGAK